MRKLTRDSYCLDSMKTQTTKQLKIWKLREN